MVSSLNDEIDFRISFDDSDDEDYTVIFDKNLFSYKIISTNDLKTDSENDNEKVMPSLPSPEPTVSCFNDLDLFKDFESEFPAIVYNDASTSKSDLLTKPILSPQLIDLNDETSLSKFDEEEQNVLYFNDLLPFNIIQPDDLKSKKDNDDNEIDIIQSSRVSVRYWSESERMIPGKGDLRDYWRSISTDGDFLGPPPSYTLIRDPVLRLCHRMMAHSIAESSQAPEKPDVAAGAPEVAEDAPVIDEGDQVFRHPCRHLSSHHHHLLRVGLCLRDWGDLRRSSWRLAGRHFRHSMGPFGGAHLQHSRDAPGRGLARPAPP
ncbi:hypothetical protein Tco_0485638 [Tanacetum coccineum]